MKDFADILRDGVTGLRVAFDKQWASLCGLTAPQQAGRIVWGTRGPLELEGVERISLGAAAVLARHDDDLRLPSLSELEPELARLLARHRHRLYLDGLRSIDAVTAKALAAHGLETVRKSWQEGLKASLALEDSPSPGDETQDPDDLDDWAFAEAIRLDSGYLVFLTLSLSGLRQLSPTVARALGQHKGILILDGLRKLSDEAAHELGNHFGTLELNGLRSLSPTAARALAYGGGPWPDCPPLDIRLRLNGLKSLSPETASELARYQGDLWLGGLRELTPAVAEALSGFQPQSRYDRLYLDGIRRLTPEAARKLAPFSATLSLAGLDTISPELAEALLEVRGRLHLPRVRRLSAKAAEILLSRLEVNLFPCLL